MGKGKKCILNGNIASRIWDRTLKPIETGSFLSSFLQII